MIALPGLLHASFESPGWKMQKTLPSYLQCSAEAMRSTAQ